MLSMPPFTHPHMLFPGAAAANYMTHVPSVQLSQSWPGSHCAGVPLKLARQRRRSQRDTVSLKQSQKEAVAPLQGWAPR